MAKRVKICKKVLARAIYSKNKAVMEAGQAFGCKMAEDTMFFRLRKGKDKGFTVYLRSDEIEGLILVLAGALWKRHRVKEIK